MTARPHLRGASTLCSHRPAHKTECRRSTRATGSTHTGLLRIDPSSTTPVGNARRSRHATPRVSRNLSRRRSVKKLGLAPFLMRSSLDGRSAARRARQRPVAAVRDSRFPGVGYAPAAPRGIRGPAARADLEPASRNRTSDRLITRRNDSTSSGLYQQLCSHPDRTTTTCPARVDTTSHHERDEVGGAAPTLIQRLPHAF